MIERDNIRDWGAAPAGLPSKRASQRMASRRGRKCGRQIHITGRACSFAASSARKRILSRM
jgi:hypothetical protein